MSDEPRDNFQPIQNPYIVGNPIRDQKMFFGREDDFNYIRQQVSGKQKSALIVLCGSRRSGKTSILFQVMNGRLGESFFPVLIDMQAMTVENDLDFLIRLGQGIVDAVGDPEISLDDDFLSRREEGSLSAFQHLINKVMSRLGGKKLVLLFDEYEIFESHIQKNLITPQVLDVFSNWLDHGDGIYIVFTGSDRLEERDEKVWGRFLQKGKHQRISFLSRNDAIRLITEPVTGMVEYEEGVPERIWELTSGQPFYTQVFCQALVDHLNEITERRVSAEALDEVLEQVIENPLPQMIFAWNSLSNLEKIAISIIGELNREKPGMVTAEEIRVFARRERIGFKIDLNILKESLEYLFNHDVLSKDEQDGYGFKMGLWQRWVGRMHSIWQVIDEVKTDIKSGEGKLGEGLSPTASQPVKIFMMVAAAAILVTGGAVGYNVFFDKSPQPQAGGVAATDWSWLTIATEPTAADVYVDGYRVEKPVVARRVPAGERAISVEYAGYHSFRDTLAIAKGDTLSRTISLTRQRGGVFVDSDPGGATIDIDGKATSYRTPASITDLAVGSHEIRIRLKNYEDRAWPTVSVEADATLELRHTFVRSTERVTISSDPSGATVIIDGAAQRESTPAVFTLTHGTHRVVLSLDGYRDDEYNITVPVAGGRLHGLLERLPPGSLVISVEPFADVYIDNSLKRQGVQFHREDNLVVGRHIIRLENQNFPAKVDTVYIKTGETAHYRFSFGGPRG